MEKASKVLLTILVLLIITVVVGWGIIFFRWYNSKMKEDSSISIDLMDNIHLQNSIGTNEIDYTNTNSRVETKEITLTESEKAQVMVMIKYNQYISEDGFKAQTLTDNELAYAGIFLDERDENEIFAHREKTAFEKNIYDFFGVTIKEAEKIELGVMGFENDEYVIGSFGSDGPSHEYEIEKVYDLGNDSIKVEFLDTATETLGEEGKQTRYKIESVFKKVPESKWGYNYVSCKIIESNI